MRLRAMALYELGGRVWCVVEAGVVVLVEERVSRCRWVGCTSY
jgi:hypothetical protein